MAPIKDKYAPKPIKLTHDGNAAVRKPYKTWDNNVERVFYKPKKRLSDGPRARSLRLFYVQHAACEKEVRH